SKLRTVLTTLGSMMSEGVRIGTATVAMAAGGSSRRELTAVSTAAGSKTGSSPCTLTKICPSVWAATSAIRSVPVRWSERVVRRHDNPRGHLCQLRPLVNALHHRLSRNLHERLARQAC